MRDDRHKWLPFGQYGDVIDLNGAELRRVQFGRQTLMSGPRVLDAVELQSAEWPGIVQGDSYAVRLRRDRVLVVNGPDRADGWDDAISCAVSDVSSSYAVFDLSGENALPLLARGAEVSLDVPSKSVVRKLFGIDVMLYRFEEGDRFRLHIASALSDAQIANFRASSKFVTNV